MLKYYNGKSYMHLHANNVVVHGASEPVLTVLDVRGFDVRELFVIGFNENCGSIVVDSYERAMAVRDALEPAYRVKVKPFPVCDGDWSADYDRRELDGSVPDSWLITNVVLTDGRQVMKNGKWTR